ncbi:MAG: hypothetical protein ABJC12_12105, partial [Saprospiraceae bacterium]
SHTSTVLGWSDFGENRTHILPQFWVWSDFGENRTHILPQFWVGLISAKTELKAKADSIHKSIYDETFSIVSFSTSLFVFSRYFKSVYSTGKTN